MKNIFSIILFLFFAFSLNAATMNLNQLRVAAGFLSAEGRLIVLVTPKNAADRKLLVEDDEIFPFVFFETMAVLSADGNLNLANAVFTKIKSKNLRPTLKGNNVIRVELNVAIDADSSSQKHNEKPIEETWIAWPGLELKITGRGTRIPAVTEAVLEKIKQDLTTLDFALVSEGTTKTLASCRRIIAAVQGS